MAGKNSIYEVFRACRLCGGGGGYKMPIVTLEDEFDMRHKIRECVRLEVHQDDKMPPLICELCVDKVNDYFEFLQMCRATDSRTRQRLGLQHVSSTVPGADTGDCILGMTEPVFVNDDSSDVEPLARQKNRIVVGGKNKKGAASTSKKNAAPVPVISIKRSNVKDAKSGVKELRVTINGSLEAGPSRSASGSRGTRSNRRAASPPYRSPPTRSARRAPTPPPSPPARRSLRDERDVSKDRKKIKETEERTLASGPSSKMSQSQRGKPKPSQTLSSLKEKLNVHGKREQDRRREESKPIKRVRIEIKPVKASPRLPAKAEKRRASPPPVKAEKRRASPSPRPEPKRAAKEPPSVPCALCSVTFTKHSSLYGHLRSMHSPVYTLERLSCNPCGEWFTTADEATSHHKTHRNSTPYVCRLCTAEFKQLTSYNKHFVFKQCVPSSEVPDVQCPECWGYFPTQPLLERHKCRGEDARPGGNCSKCKRKFATLKNLRKHEESCFKPGPKSRGGGGGSKVSPELLQRVVPIQVRMARCDPLLSHVKQEAHIDVSHVASDYGLDKSCVYPYISSVRSIKREIFDEHDIKQEIDFDEVEYESFTDSDSEPEFVEPIDGMQQRLVANPFARKKKSIDALSTLSIKAIFSPKLLGPRKIQRKRKRRPIVKPELKEETVIDSQTNNEKDINERETTINEQTERDDDDVRRTVDGLIAGLCTTNDIDDVTKGVSNVEITVKLNKNGEGNKDKDQDTEKDKAEIEVSEVISANDTETKEKNVLEGDEVVELAPENSSNATNYLETVHENKKTAEAMECDDSDSNFQIYCENKSRANGEITEQKTDKNISHSKENETTEKDEANNKLRENDEDFDINSVFSGKIGSTALKAQGKPKIGQIDSIHTDSLPNDSQILPQGCSSESSKVANVNVSETFAQESNIPSEINNSNESETFTQDVYQDTIAPECSSESSKVANVNLSTFTQESNVPNEINHSNKSQTVTQDFDQDASEVNAFENKLLESETTDLHKDEDTFSNKESDADQIVERPTDEFSSINKNNKESIIKKNEEPSTKILESEEASNNVSNMINTKTESPEKTQDKTEEINTGEKSDSIYSNSEDKLAGEKQGDTEFMDDNELMEAIDAQIGDKTEKKGVEKSENDEKISLDELLNVTAEVTQPQVKDNIDTDFSFDG